MAQVLLAGTPWDIANKYSSLDRLVWTPDGATSIGGTTYTSKSYFGHISENFEARDLIFGTDVL